MNSLVLIILACLASSVSSSFSLLLCPKDDDGKRQMWCTGGIFGTLNCIICIYVIYKLSTAK